MTFFGKYLLKKLKAAENELFQRLNLNQNNYLDVSAGSFSGACSSAPAKDSSEFPDCFFPFIRWNIQ